MKTSPSRSSASKTRASEKFSQVMNSLGKERQITTASSKDLSKALGGNVPAGFRPSLLQSFKRSHTFSRYMTPKKRPDGLCFTDLSRERAAADTYKVCLENFSYMPES